MICYKNGKRSDVLPRELLEAKANEKYLVLLTVNEFLNDNIGVEIDSDIRQKMTEEFNNHNNISSKFDSHDAFDIIYINIPKQLKRCDNVNSLSFYISENILLIVYVPWKEYDGFCEILDESLKKSSSFGRNILNILDTFTREDSHVLQSIEEKITNSEDDLLTSYNKDYIKEIVGLRKELLSLKRYYEQMIDLFDNLNENENVMFNESELKHCGNISNRVKRLYNAVISLRDYVTQVREAYQSQADLNLNAIMKVFTVLSAIFLPLTLIAGWYGMNFQMPEYTWIYGYPAVISISVAVVLICIVIFKKNNWF